MVSIFTKMGGHKNTVPIPDGQRILVHASDDIDFEIGKQMEQFNDKRKSILLSGGMDSVIVTSYLRGSNMYCLEKFLEFNENTID